MLKGLLKELIEKIVDIWASLERFSFPSKYRWRWKLEMLLKRYEPETTKFVVDHLKPGMVVLDIGAHIGYYTRLAARLVGKGGQVHAFEPDDENFALLEKNTSKYDNVILHKMAVGEKDGYIDFYHVENSTGCHTTVRPSGHYQEKRVTVTTIDSLVDKSIVGTVDFIKLDVEGGEWAAVNGMKKLLSSSKDVRLVVEVDEDDLGHAGYTCERFIGLLESFGFAIVGKTGSKDRTETNIFFAKNHRHE